MTIESKVQQPLSQGKMILMEKNTKPRKNLKTFSTTIKESISDAIGKSGLSRGEVAGRCSDLLGYDVKLTAIDNICSVSKQEYLPRVNLLLAICLVTNSIKPFESMAEHLPHCHVIQDNEALKLELFETDQHLDRLTKKREELRKRLQIQEFEEVIQ